MILSSNIQVRFLKKPDFRGFGTHSPTKRTTHAAAQAKYRSTDAYRHFERGYAAYWNNTSPELTERVRMACELIQQLFRAGLTPQQFQLLYREGAQRFNYYGIFDQPTLFYETRLVLSVRDLTPMTTPEQADAFVQSYEDEANALLQTFHNVPEIRSFKLMKNIGFRLVKENMKTWVRRKKGRITTLIESFVPKQALADAVIAPLAFTKMGAMAYGQWVLSLEYEKSTEGTTRVKAVLHGYMVATGDYEGECIRQYIVNCGGECNPISTYNREKPKAKLDALLEELHASGAEDWANQVCAYIKEEAAQSADFFEKWLDSPVCKRLYTPKSILTPFSAQGRVFDLQARLVKETNCFEYGNPAKARDYSGSSFAFAIFDLLLAITFVKESLQPEKYINLLLWAAKNQLDQGSGVLARYPEECPGFEAAGERLQELIIHYKAQLTLEKQWTE